MQYFQATKAQWDETGTDGVAQQKKSKRKKKDKIRNTEAVASKARNGLSAEVLRGSGVAVVDCCIVELFVAGVY